ncbi:LamG domain containing protein [uncultured Caudovirales phage]|uniref:LamG domain containing protein n=1 Tax=uncultured Caudovirales phage TaxID=2100421 RepID=A0A6J5MRJ0_9CAUD|nr:LamG domain containing protein [uncultured Caudovirales phage]
MSLYSERVAQDSPLFYFENNSSGVNNTGSITPSIITGSSTAFTSSGGIQNSPYLVNAGRTGEYGFEYSNSTTIFDDKAFSITGWFKVASTDINSTPNWIFHTGTTANGIYLEKTDKLYVVTQFGTSNTATSTAPSYDAWHHIAVTMDATYLRLYIDGTLANLDFTPASLSIDSLVKYWMRATTAGTPRNGVIGNFDEWAVFNTTLSATTIEEHAAAGFGAKINETPATATALAVDPAISTQVVIVETPATATAASGDHYNSTIDGFTLLDTYMSTLTLEQFYKFDEPKTITNYGSGDDIAFIYGGDARNDVTSGVQNHGALRITGTSNSIVAALGASSANPFLDENFSIGFWVKKTTNEDALIFAAHGDTDSFTVDFNPSGQIRATIFASNQNHTITSSTDYADGNWHYVAVRLASNTLQLWVDGTSIGTTAMTHSLDEFYVIDFSAGSGSNTELMYVSHFYIATATNVTSTEIANIWSYGQATLQGGAAMPMPKFSRNNSLNYYIEDKSPVFYFKMDEATGVPLNYGSASISLAPLNSSFTQNITSPNYKAYNFTDRNTQFTGAWSVPAGTFTTDDQQTIVVYTKFNSGNASGLFSTASFGGTTGSGLLIQQIANGTVRLRIQDDTYNNFITTSSSYADGNYHMIVGVKDATSLKLYIDGVEVVTGTISAVLTDAGQLAIGGLPGLIPPTGSRDVTLDELAVFDFAFTAGQAFDIYQAISWSMDWTATALAVDPAVSTGFGPTIAEPSMNASAEFSNVFPFIPPMTSEAIFLNPNYEAIKNTDNLADPMTASAEGQDPGWNIGENNTVLHMDASASFPDARALIPGFWNASPAIANPAEMVDPAISSTLGALIVTQSMPAQGIFVSPPAYKLITDDIWYQKLYLQHSVLNGERFKTDNLPGTVGTPSASAFLKLFDDVTTSIGGANTNKIINNLPNSIITDNPGSTDTSTQYANASNAFLTATPTPLLEVGTFDDYERKAVRFRNIQFEIPENNYVSNNGYSLEFTFKSTKSDQVIAQGLQRSFLYNQSATSSIGLYDGKLFASRVTQSITGAKVFAHPDNEKLAYAINTAYGNKRIDDGLWHHIIIQYGFGGRVQFWIDGQLDIQFLDDNRYGYGATIRPYIIGSNQSNPRWQSDFETSAWSYDAAFFVDSQNIIEHYTASFKYEPIKAEPATATVEIGQGTKGEGNRPRALMLYFWPTSSEQTGTPFGRTEYTSTESPDQLTTLDYYTSPPQNYEGWDVFPVDVTGYWVSDLVKKEAYGVENIGRTAPIQSYSLVKQPDRYALINTRYTFRNPLTDASRYIDLINDIDLSKFDMIMFKNYPNDPNEKDSFTGSEVVDSYFNVRESAIFEDFLKSLRAAVDTGLSLIVANSQLALDLKIVDRVEVVPDMDDDIGQGNYSDEYAPTQIIGTGAEDLPVPPEYDQPLGWWDTWKNNRTRIVNTHPGITDYPSLITTQMAFWYNSDEYRWGGPDRVFKKSEHKDALAVGDEFVISTTGRNADNNRLSGYLATPFENVKAGKIITAFANTVRRGLELIENPYKNYAQSIILEPGDVLDGTQVGGKIYVNFTEEINKVEDSVPVELTSDYWVNYAYDNGAISLEDRDALLLEDFVTTETPYWSLNGMNLLQQRSGEYELDTNFNRSGLQKEAVKVRKVNKNGGISFQSVASGSVFFSSTYSWRYPMASFESPSMPTRGFRWLSNREVIDGTVLRPQAFAASSEMPEAVGIPDKELDFKAQSMVATAGIEETQFSSGERQVLALPMTATADIVKPGSTIGAPPMLANAGMFANNRSNVASEDQVVLYLIHVDPILYIREDVIK